MRISKNIVLGLGVIVTTSVLASTALSCSVDGGYNLKKLNIKALKTEFDRPLILDSNEVETLENNRDGDTLTLTPQNINYVFPIFKKLFNFGENKIPSDQLLKWNKDLVIRISSTIFVEDSVRYGRISFRLRGNVDGVNTDYEFIDGNQFTQGSHWRSR